MKATLFGLSSEIFQTEFCDIKVFMELIFIWPFIQPYFIINLPEFIGMFHP